MSADSRQSNPTTGAYWTAHGLEQWHNSRRNDVPDRDADRGWRESVDVDYPSARDGARARYHPEGDCVLIVQRDLGRHGRGDYVVTVLALSDRPVEEQAYVRVQAEYGGGRR